MDTGSDISFIREDTYKEIGSPPEHETDVTLLGIEDKPVEVLGYVQTPISIDNNEYPLTLYVFSNKCTMHKVTIGHDIIPQAKIIFEEDGISDEKRKQTIFLTRIDTIVEPWISADHIPDSKIRDDAVHLLESYEPNKIKETNIEMTIALSVNIPIFQEP